MKTKVIIGCIAVIVIAVVLVGNWYVGRRVEKAVSLAIYQRMRSGRVPLAINYDDISANPLLGRIKLRSLGVVEESSGTKLLLGSMKLSCKLSDLIAVARKGTQAEFHGLKLGLNDVSVLQGERGKFLSADKVHLRLDGSISSEKLSGGVNGLLNDKRRVRLKIEGADIPAFRSEHLGRKREYLQFLSTIERAAVDIGFDPVKEELEVYDVELRSPQLELCTKGKLQMSRVETGSPALERLVAEAGLFASPKGCMGLLPALGLKEKISAAGINLDARVDYRFPSDERVLFPEGKVELSVEELAVELSMETRRALGLKSLENFAADKIRITAECNDGLLNVGDVSVKSPHANVDGEFRIDLNERDVDHSEIKKARLRVSDISDDLMPFFVLIEKATGRKILKGNEAELKWAGRLGNPRFITGGERGKEAEQASRSEPAPEMSRRDRKTESKDFRGDVLWIAEYGAGRVTGVDPKTGNRIITYSRASHPVELASAPGGCCWILDAAGGGISLLDPRGKVLASGGACGNSINEMDRLPPWWYSGGRLSYDKTNDCVWVLDMCLAEEKICLKSLSPSGKMGVELSSSQIMGGDTPVAIGVDSRRGGCWISGDALAYVTSKGKVSMPLNSGIEWGVSVSPVNGTVWLLFNGTGLRCFPGGRAPRVSPTHFYDDAMDICADVLTPSCYIAGLFDGVLARHGEDGSRDVVASNLPHPYKLDISAKGVVYVTCLGERGQDNESLRFRSNSGMVLGFSPRGDEVLRIKGLNMPVSLAFSAR